MTCRIMVIILLISTLISRFPEGINYCSFGTFLCLKNTKLWSNFKTKYCRNYVLWNMEIRGNETSSFLQYHFLIKPFSLRFRNSLISIFKRFLAEFPISNLISGLSVRDFYRDVRTPVSETWSMVFSIQKYVIPRVWTWQDHWTYNF
jgi:hypothetical protein